MLKYLLEFMIIVSYIASFILLTFDKIEYAVCLHALASCLSKIDPSEDL